MTRHTSVAMTASTEEVLLDRLIRADGQEDILLATYRPSTGATRTTALISTVIPPKPGDRHIHGNATINSQYILRAAEIAQRDGEGLVLVHSHPNSHGWQRMSQPDRVAEASYANLIRELTGLPLVGMTVAGADHTWSARHWDLGVGTRINCTHSTNVRILGARLAVSWNDVLCPPPQPTNHQVRTLNSWGDRCQADLARRRILVVGAGSVGLDIVVRLAASGLCDLTVMDFDLVEAHNLDRLIGASARDARLLRTKTYVAQREADRASTAAYGQIEVTDRSICEPDGVRIALDHDLIFSCVDRPWPRAVLNALAYSDLIPVIDGGIAIDTFDNGTMRNATWRSHVIRPDRPCMSCNRQLDLSQVSLDQQGLLDNPAYITSNNMTEPTNQNVAPLSINVAATLLAQYVSFSVAPGHSGEPGPLQYALNTHNLEHRDDVSRSDCPIEAQEGVGDRRISLTSTHDQAEQQRQRADVPTASILLLRWVDHTTLKITKWLDHSTRLAR